MEAALSRPTSCSLRSRSDLVCCRSRCRNRMQGEQAGCMLPQQVGEAS